MRAACWAAARGLAPVFVVVAGRAGRTDLSRDAVCVAPAVAEKPLPGYLLEEAGVAVFFPMTCCAGSVSGTAHAAESRYVPSSTVDRFLDRRSCPFTGVTNGEVVFVAFDGRAEGLQGQAGSGAVSEECWR